MIPELLPIIAGIAALAAGAAKYVQSWLRDKQSTSTQIAIGTQRIELSGNITKEQLATLIEVLQRGPSDASKAAVGSAVEHPGSK